MGGECIVYYTLLDFQGRYVCNMPTCEAIEVLAISKNDTMHFRVCGHHTTVQKKEGIQGRHFSKEGHNFKIQIIEIFIPGQNETEGALNSKRQERELSWQK